MQTLQNQKDSGLDETILENVKCLPDGSIRAACPACRAAGSDSTKDHLLIQPSGKFGCATHKDDRAHRQEIFRLAAKRSPLPTTNGHANGNGSRQIVTTYDYQDASGKLIFQVCRYDPKDFRQRKPDATALDGWQWNTKGIEKVLFRLPETIKDIKSGHPIFLTEGEKDALAMTEKGFSATCNPGGAGKWQDNYSETLRGAACFVIADKDKAGREHAALVASKLHGVAKSVRVIELPDVNGKPVKDASDYFQAGGDVGKIWDLVDAAPEFTVSIKNESSLTIRTPDELLAMQFDEGDRILGDRVIAKGQGTVIAGQGGLGKSRLALQFIAACRAGLPFIGFETRGQEMKWLVLQAENSNRRLQHDFSKLHTWIGEKHWPQVNAGIFVHTLESDADNFLSLDNERTQAAIRELVSKIKPDGIVWDSLYNFGIGNLSGDEDMTATLLSIARLSKAGNPQRAIVVLHHALTGKTGIAKAQGWERAGFARNSKVLHQWARAQVNVSPGLPDSNDVLVVTCGKCSNGKEFQPFAVRLDPETMIYSLDETFDLSAWQAEVTGKKDNAPLMTPERVRELCRAAMPKAELSKAIMADCGCARQVSYKYIQRAEKRGQIKWNPRAEHFNPK